MSVIDTGSPEGRWEPLWKTWRGKQWRPWAWLVATVAPPLSIFAVLLGAMSALYGVMMLAQSGFAVLYLMRRASWVTAAIASGVWLAWVAVTIAARFIGYASVLRATGQEPITIEGLVAGLLGSIAGSLVWAGLALFYFWRTTFCDETKAPSSERR